MARAAQEGIVFALRYGMEVMQSMGMQLSRVRAGHANMFLSPLFREAFANVSGCVLELYNTDGAQGAARAAGVGAGVYPTFREAFSGMDMKAVCEPEQDKTRQYRDAYARWRHGLREKLDRRGMGI
jgi:xylulokinase